MTVRGDGLDASAWTLNVSRGGIRVVIEEPVNVGSEYEVTVGEDEPRLARAVWVRKEADGQIAGFQFLDVELQGELSEPPGSL